MSFKFAEVCILKFNLLNWRWVYIVYIDNNIGLLHLLYIDTHLHLKLDTGNVVGFSVS